MTNDPATNKAIETIVETVVKDIIATVKGIGSKAWEELRWMEAARKYREQLKDRYGTMRVLGKPKPN